MISHGITRQPGTPTVTLHHDISETVETRKQLSREFA
jgi:hypothetical protein